MDDEQMTFGPWLQQRRLQLGLTQEWDLGLFAKGRQ